MKWNARPCSTFVLGFLVLRTQLEASWATPRNKFERIEVEQHLLTKVSKGQERLLGEMLVSKSPDPFDLLRPL